MLASLQTLESYIAVPAEPVLDEVFTEFPVEYRYLELYVFITRQPPPFAIWISHTHLDGMVKSLTVTIDTDVLLVLAGTPRYFVVSELDRNTYPPSTNLISQRIELPNEDIRPDDAVAAEEA
jgi:hypothetical protein